MAGKKGKLFADVMFPIQIVRESTLTITDQVRQGLPGTNPLSDRLWNLGTTLFYKCGRKPWKTPWARERSPLKTKTWITCTVCSPRWPACSSAMAPNSAYSP